MFTVFEVTPPWRDLQTNCLVAMASERKKEKAGRINKTERALKVIEFALLSVCSKDTILPRLGSQFSLGSFLSIQLD